MTPQKGLCCYGWPQKVKKKITNYELKLFTLQPSQYWKSNWFHLFEIFTTRRLYHIISYCNKKVYCSSGISKNISSSMSLEISLDLLYPLFFSKFRSRSWWRSCDIFSFANLLQVQWSFLFLRNGNNFFWPRIKNCSTCQC